MPRRRRPASSSPEGPPRVRARRRSARLARRRERQRETVVRNILKDTAPTDVALSLTDVNYQLDSNRKQHQTSDYELQGLIVRRGQEFKLTITFDRKYNDATQEIILQFSIGDTPMESKGTLIRVSLKPTSKTVASGWKARLAAARGRSIDVTVLTPSDAIVGNYKFCVETRDDTDRDGNFKITRKNIAEPIVVLFNAWCKDDNVYMENKTERQEYVMNENGAIWTGSRRNFGPRPWTFGQFEEVCIKAVFYLLKQADLDITAWGNPIKVIRTLSAMANSNDDEGVLEGKWSDPYPRGTTVPWAWTGSVGIIEQFMDTQLPVQFGQCWVFSGLVTTLCRGVGIPTRSVTNFESAHDSDTSITIDTYWNKDFSKDEDGSNDSIWNFHVWNESWFKRPDLPPGYDGWQVHDATPQETSEGVMRCGPAPLKAVKEGHVYLNYDIPFVFAEVNGDKLNWQHQEDGTMKCVFIEKNKVGHFISTKAPGTGHHRLDITDLYKYPEGSADERRVAKSVFGLSHLRKEYDVYDLNIKKDVTFREEIPSLTKYGEDLEFPVYMTNASSQARTVTVKMSAMSALYTGQTAARIKEGSFTVTLGPKKSDSVTLPIKASEYRAKLLSGDFIQMYVVANVEETQQRFIHSETVQLAVPGLSIEAPSNVKQNTPFKLKINFANTLGMDLTKGVFRVSAPGIQKNLNIEAGNVALGDFIEEEVSLEALRPGPREIVVTFDTDELHDIIGSKEVIVSNK